LWPTKVLLKVINVVVRDGEH